MTLLSKFWAVLAIVGSVLAFGANVKADTAVSNIASWANLFGWDSLVIILSTSNADRQTLVVGIVFVLLAILLWWLGRPNRAGGNIYEDQIIRITDLKERNTAIIYDKKFKRCLIIGPARLALSNRNSFMFCSSAGAIHIEREEGSPIRGALKLEKVDFFECFFADDVAIEMTSPDVCQIAHVIAEESVDSWKAIKWSFATKVKIALTRS
jgi:hypothetical protein